MFETAGIALGALRPLKIYDDENLISNAAAMGKHMEMRVEKMKEKHPSIGDYRNTGLLGCIELVKNQGTKETFAPAQRANAQLAAICLRRGLVIYPGGGTADGINGDHFLLCPPFTIKEAELDELFGILDEALTEFELSL